MSKWAIWCWPQHNNNIGTPQFLSSDKNHNPPRTLGTPILFDTREAAEKRIEKHRSAVQWVYFIVEMDE